MFFMFQPYHIFSFVPCELIFQPGYNYSTASIVHQWHKYFGFRCQLWVWLQASENFQERQIMNLKKIVVFINGKIHYFQMEFLLEGKWKALPLPSFELLQLHFRSGLFGRQPASLGECGKSGLLQKNWLQGFLWF